MLPPPLLPSDPILSIISCSNRSHRSAISSRRANISLLMPLNFFSTSPKKSSIASVKAAVAAFAAVVFVLAIAGVVVLDVVNVATVAPVLLTAPADIDRETLTTATEGLEMVPVRKFTAIKKLNDSLEILDLEQDRQTTPTPSLYLIFSSITTPGLASIMRLAGWTEQSRGVKIVLLISVRPSTQTITIEKWEQGDQSITMDTEYIVTGAPLTLNFEKVFLHQPVPPQEHDLITNSLATISTAARSAVLDLLFEPSPALHTLADAPLLTQTAYPTYSALIAAVRQHLTNLRNSDLDTDQAQLNDILSSHPRLGAKKAAAATATVPEALSEMSRREQEAMRAAEGAVSAPEQQGSTLEERLSALNDKYEATFGGLKYVTFVNGRPRPVIMEDMERRIERADLAQEKLDGIEKLGAE
ncbi:hypothetical protein DV735_g5326, partial [Chaetothyriales sp. CBS 134920]